MTEENETTQTTVDPVAPEAPAEEPAVEAEEPAVEAEEPAVEADAPAEEPAVETDAPAEEPAIEASAPAVEEPAVEDKAPTEEISASNEEEPSPDGSDARDTSGDELPEGVMAWWNGWGQLRGYLVSATDRGQPHPEMAATAQSLTDAGASVDALAVWVPTPEERSRLERSRRTVNSACDANQNLDEALERVRADLAGEDPVWAQLTALAEAWIGARRAGLEPARRRSRKGRSRGRGRDREAKTSEERKDDAEPKRERGDRKRRRNRRSKRPAVPQGKWASAPSKSWARDEDEFTVFVWFEPTADEVQGAVAGVLWTDWDADPEKLPLTSFIDFDSEQANTAALGSLAALEKTGKALPFRVSTDATDPLSATTAALRLVFGWLLPEGDKADVRVVLSHAGVEATEDGEPTVVTEALAGALQDGGEALADRFARWDLDSAVLLAAQRGDVAEIAPEHIQRQGYLSYAWLLAATRAGGPAAELADSHLSSPHFEGALPLTTADLAALESIAAIDRTAATDELLDLVPRLTGTALLDPLLAGVRKRIGANAGLQLKLLLGLDARTRTADSLDAALALIRSCRPLLGELPGAAPARLRALWLLSSARGARRHEELSEVATAWGEARDEALSADPKVAVQAALGITERLFARVDHNTGRDLLQGVVSHASFGTLDLRDRSALIGALATAESACGFRLSADARFAAAIDRLDSIEGDEDLTAQRQELLRLRALNAIDARLHLDADSVADTPTEVIERVPEEPTEAAAEDDAADDVDTEAPNEDSEVKDEAPTDDTDTETEDTDAETTDTDAETAEDNATEDDAADDVDTNDADAETEELAPIRNAGPREALGDQAVDLVLTALGAEDLSTAARELATAEDRTAEHGLLLHLLWAREDLSDVEDAYLDAANTAEQHTSADIELYRGLLLFMAGKDRDARKCVSRAVGIAREQGATADRLKVAAFQTVSACLEEGRGKGRRRSSLRQLEERLPASAHPLLQTLQAIQAKPDEDKIDLALGALPITLR